MWGRRFRLPTYLSSQLLTVGAMNQRFGAARQQAALGRRYFPSRRAYHGRGFCMPSRIQISRRGRFTV